MVQLLHIHCCIYSPILDDISEKSRFVVGFPVPEVGHATPPQLSVLVTTNEPGTVNFTVTASGFYTKETVSILLPVQVPIMNSYEVVTVDDRNGGILIESDRNNSICVIGLLHHFDGTSTDAFLLLPVTEILVDLYEYYGMTGYNNNDARLQSFILLVANEDNTTVSTITLNLTLNALETYLIKATDLTGLRITSSKPISVFSGHDCSNVPASVTTSCDVIIEQIPPTATWGTRFLVASLMGRNSGELVKILGVRTSVVMIFCNNISPSPIVAQLLHSGDVYNFNMEPGSLCMIEATFPVLVVQYSESRFVDNMNGDPAMMIIPSMEQYTNKFVIESFSGFSLNFITVYVTSEFFQPSEIFFDSLVLDVLWEGVNCSNGEVCGYIAKKEVVVGTHFIEHRNASCVLGLSVYGFSHIVGYAYPGGLGVDPIQCDCEPDVYCINNNGRFRCGCPEGYLGNGITCSGKI